MSSSEHSEGESDYEKKVRSIHHRMYEDVYPKPEDLVYVKIVEIKEIGADAALLEYDNIKGMILGSEITLKRVNYVRRLLQVNKEEVVRVLRVDNNKGYIDLSKKAVKPEEAEECKKKYKKSKQVDLILRNLSVKTEVKIEKLYKHLAWPLYREYGHCFDAFKLILEGDKNVLEKISFKNKEKEELIKKKLIELIELKMKPLPSKIRADFELKCFTFEGVEAIKEALLSGEKKGTEKIPIKFKTLGSPAYECTISTINKQEGMDVVNNAIKEVERVIKEKGGIFSLKEKPRIIGENERKKSTDTDGTTEEEEEEEEEVEGMGIKDGDLKNFD